MAVKSLRLRNFKRFSDFRLTLDQANVLVGPNNSGKSTILDAFRVLAACLRFAKSKSPELLDFSGEGVFSGYQVPEQSIPVPLANVTNNYSDEDAIVEFANSDGHVVSIKLHPHRPTRFFLSSGTKLPRTPRHFIKEFPDSVVIVPTLAPLEETEPVLAEATVRRNEATRLASRNFRNIWYQRRHSDFADFDSFCQIVEAHWPNISLLPPEIVTTTPPRIEMFFRERGIQREVYWAGFGFQVWLQMVMHILRGGGTSTIVIDEPDIYLHPDMQRRLLRLLSERSGQFVLATHSIEIINESEPGTVIVVDPRKRSGRRVQTEQEYQAVFDYIGSVENIEFARLARAKRIVFFEGKDKRIIQRLAKKLHLEAGFLDSRTTFLQAGGFGQWQRVREVEWTLSSVLKMNVKIIAIFDRDFRSDEEIDAFLDQFIDAGLRVVVLRRKEIENYLLELPVLERLVASRLRQAGHSEEVPLRDIVAEVSAGFRSNVRSQIGANFRRFHRDRGDKRDDATLLEVADARFELAWNELRTRLHRVPGKDFISALSARLQKDFGISLSTAQLVGEIRAAEIDSELIGIIQEVADLAASDAEPLEPPS